MRVRFFLRRLVAEGDRFGAPPPAHFQSRIAAYADRNRIGDPILMLPSRFTTLT
jgi:hypothetical protein